MSISSRCNPIAKLITLQIPWGRRLFLLHGPAARTGRDLAQQSWCRVLPRAKCPVEGAFAPLRWI